jgi:HAE1 family hydrophobic/amphiphilic exporter-1
MVPTGFIPTEDTGQLSANVVAAQGTSFQRMTQYQAQVAAIVQRDTNVAHSMSSIGSTGGGGATNEGRLLMSLAPDKRLPADEIVNELRPKLSGIPGINVFMQVPPAIQIGARSAKAFVWCGAIARCSGSRGWPAHGSSCITCRSRC